MIHHGDTETRSKLLYLKLTGKHVGMIINFNVAVLVRGGIVRKVL
jgi:hypothetical protein